MHSTVLGASASGNGDIAGELVWTGGKGPGERGRTPRPELCLDVLGQFAACLGVRGASPARARRVIPCLAGVILVEPLEWLQVVP